MLNACYKKDLGGFYDMTPKYFPVLMTRNIVKWCTLNPARLNSFLRPRTLKSFMQQPPDLRHVSAQQKPLLPVNPNEFTTSLPGSSEKHGRLETCLASAANLRPTETFSHFRLGFMDFTFTVGLQGVGNRKVQGRKT